MLEKKHATSQKVLEKVEKSSNELLRERDAIQMELKKTESMFFTFGFSFG